MYLFGNSESEIRKRIKNIIIFSFPNLVHLKGPQVENKIKGLLIKVKGKNKSTFLVKVKVKLGKE